MLTEYLLALGLCFIVAGVTVYFPVRFTSVMGDGTDVTYDSSQSIEGYNEIPKLPTTIEGNLCICPNEYYEGFYVIKLIKK